MYIIYNNIFLLQAFDLKARRQLAVVMDRRSLHKSRLESEALRRLESSTFLAASFDNHSPSKKPTVGTGAVRPLSAGNSRSELMLICSCSAFADFIHRYAPMVKRPMSGKRQYMSALDNGYEEMREQHRQANNRSNGLMDHFPVLNDSDLPLLDELTMVAEEALGTAGSLVSAAPTADSSVTVKTQGGKEEKHTIAKSGRQVVEKPKPEFKPMKFKSALPEGFVAKQKKVKQIALENYLQVHIIFTPHSICLCLYINCYPTISQEFDSDEEKDAPESVQANTQSRQISKTIATQDSMGSPQVPKMQKSKSMPVGSGIAAILSKRDPIRDRPVSAQRFREISATDSEMKVLYRYSNFRRMPLTEEQV